MATETTLKIPAMHCSSCADTVTKLVKKLGVSEVNIDVDSKLVDLTYDETKVNLEQIRESLDESGFFAED